MSKKEEEKKEDDKNQKSTILQLGVDFSWTLKYVDTPSSPSMTNLPMVCEFKFIRYGGRKNTSLAAKGALANRLQRHTAYKIQNGRQGAPKWQRGSGKVSTPRFLGVPVNFR